MKYQEPSNSSFECEVLKAIYERRIELPDSAQELIPEANCKPDFLYKKEKIAIFCDGLVHDSTEQQQRDCIKRQELIDIGYEVMELKYKGNCTLKLCLTFGTYEFNAQ